MAASSVPTRVHWADVITPAAFQKTWKSVASGGRVSRLAWAPGVVVKTSPSTLRGRVIDPTGCPSRVQKAEPIPPVCASMFVSRSFAPVGASEACPTGRPPRVNVTAGCTTPATGPPLPLAHAGTRAPCGVRQSRYAFRAFGSGSMSYTEPGRLS